MIDPYLITTGLAAGAAVFLFVSGKVGRAALVRNGVRLIAAEGDANKFKRQRDNLQAIVDRADAQRRAASAKGTAQAVANRAAERAARKSNTTEALNVTELRPRAEVVAPVVAKRARTKSDPGVAGKKAGSGR